MLSDNQVARRLADPTLPTTPRAARIGQQYIATWFIWPSERKGIEARQLWNLFCFTTKLKACSCVVAVGIMIAQGSNGATLGFLTITTGTHNMSDVNSSMSIVNFQFDESIIRVIIDEHGNPWFIANDVALTLGYRVPKKAVYDHCKKAKSLIDIGVLKQYPQLDQQLKLIPESDVYRLIMQSKLDSAERFQDWVVEEVLPSIRKTGAYAPAMTLAEQLLAQAKVNVELERRQKEMEIRQQALEERIDKSYSELLHEDRTYTSTDLAKEVGFRSAIALLSELHNRGIVYKPMGQRHYIPYADYADRGLCVVRDEFISGYRVRTLRWTEQGRVFLVDLFRHRQQALTFLYGKFASK